MVGRAEPVPEWELLLLPHWEELEAPCRLEPDPEERLLWEYPVPGLNSNGLEEPPWATLELLEPLLELPLEPPLEPLEPLGPLLEPLLEPLEPLEPPLEPLLEPLELEM